MNKSGKILHGGGLVWKMILACTILFLALSGPLQAHSPSDGFDAFVSGSTQYTRINSVVLQPDGKIVIAGNFTEVDGQNRSHIARLHPDGSLDEDFVPGDIDDIIYGLALQSDGKIVIAGDFTEVDGQDRSHIARLHPDGSLDEGFVPVVINDSIYGLALQSDGKIVIAGGFTEVDGQDKTKIARLHPDGSLDEDFVPAHINNIIYGLALQPDGKIVIVGVFSEVDGQDRTRIARLHPDGSLDQGFIPDPGSPTAVFNAYAVVLQPDGKIVISYRRSAFPNPNEHHVVRLNPDGSLDENFAASIYSVSSDHLRLTGLALQPDGRIFVAGRGIRVGNDEPRAMVRLNPDGSIDDQFISPDFHFSGAMRIHDLAVQPDGKLVVVGRFREVDGYNPNPELDPQWLPSNNIVRLYPDGGQELDMLAAVQDSLSGWLRINALALQPDSSVLLGGDFDVFYYVDEGYGSGVQRRRAAGLKPNGFLDDAFDPGSNQSIFAYAVQPDNGIIVGKQDSISRWKPDGTNDSGFMDWDTNGAVRALAVQPDGKILVAGVFTEITAPNSERFPRNRLIRLDENGFLDNHFQFTGSNGPNLSVFSLALQPDGKVIVAGNFTTFNGNPNYKYIVRLNPDKTVDTDFNPPDLNDGVYALALQPDGKIVIGGAFTTVAPFTSQRRIARLNPDGSLDSGFMTGIVSTPGMNADVRTLALQTDGKIWAGGNFTSISVGTGSQTTNRIVRLHPSGSLDKAFPAGADGVHGTGGPEGANVNALALQADGKVLVGGHFTQLQNEERSCIGRMIQSTATEAAFQELSVNSSGTVVSWDRSGPAPEFHRVSFEQSVDGQNYTALGPGFYNLDQGSWQLDGLSLNLGEGVWVRARGHFSTGRYNGSGSMLESVRYFSGQGNLQVNIVPAQAKWRRAGTTDWRSSGAIEYNVPLGTHTVQFSRVAGWNSKTNEIFNITSGENIEHVNYTQNTSQHRVSVAAPGQGGTVSGGGTFVHNAWVTLTASPDPGFVFSHWTDGGQVVEGAGATYSFYLTSNRNLTAHFRKIISLPGVMMLLLDDE
ncbi:hypothetical protein [Desulfonatronum sp. SC1]|uniref:InlB B-repeat-containing protein n=1 Tax=Desulfonatronum sp. SC1 TaxID=2109626 RepID=UPI000D304730|nr:hypothetical protein [Desulfonatronum sp. SC1]PTN35145.1 hypothetical protein C6366_11535 [Desulfonatronum sp. SC1]